MDSSEMKRKLLYRSWHRGCKEMDILLGDFAKESLEALSDNEVRQYQKLLEINDVDLYDWLSGKRVVPAEYDNQIFSKIRVFHEEKASRQV